MQARMFWRLHKPKHVSNMKTQVQKPEMASKEPSCSKHCRYSYISVPSCVIVHKSRIIKCLVGVFYRVHLMTVKYTGC